MHAREHVERPGRVRVGELESIAQLEQHASACELCRLRRDRTGVVVGSGPADAEVLVVAEAPSWHDDRHGAMLSGSVAPTFDNVLELAGLRREDVFVTSVVKCRPPTGRTPFPDEVETCEGWLFREIALVQPRVVVTLGGLALRLVTGRQERLADVHGEMLHAHVQGRDVVVWPLYHPAAALHVPTLLAELQADARALGGLLRGARATGATQASPTSAVATTERVNEAPAAEPTEPGDVEPQLTLDM